MFDQRKVRRSRPQAIVLLLVMMMVASTATASTEGTKGANEEPPVVASQITTTNHEAGESFHLDPEPGQQRWSARYSAGINDHDSDRPCCTEVVPDGSRVIVTGQSGWHSATSTKDFATVAYDPITGEKLWESRYVGPGNSFPEEMDITPNGEVVVVTGRTISENNGLDWLTAAYDTETGEELWVAQYNGAGNGIDQGEGVAVTDTIAVVTGFATSESSQTKYLTSAYDIATGDELWTSVYSWDGNSRGEKVDLSPDGQTAVVTGTSRDDATGNDWATVAYDVSDGDELWSVRYNGDGDSGDSPAHVVVGPAGTRAFVGGVDRQEPGTSQRLTDAVVIAYELDTGNQLWIARHDGVAAGRDSIRAMDTSSDGNILYTTGYSDVAFLNPDAVTIAYDTDTGEQLWLASYDHSGTSDIAYGMEVTETRVYVVGETVVPSSGGGPGNVDWISAAYDAQSGAELWVRTHDQIGRWDMAFDVAAIPTPVGNIVISVGYFTVRGQNGNGTEEDFGLIAYNDVHPDQLPVLRLSEGQASAIVDGGESGEMAITMENVGNSPLLWDTFEDENLESSAQASSSSGSAAVSPGNGFLSPQPNVEEPGIHHPERSSSDDEQRELSHSTSDQIVIPNSVACQSEVGDGTMTTSYLRTFNLEEFGIDDAFEVETVAFGIESLRTNPQQVMVNLYTIYEDQELSYNNMIPVSSTEVTLSPQTASIAEVPVTGTIRPGATMVVEVHSPDQLETADYFFIGSNSEGQSAPSYISSTQCGMEDPVDLATVGHENMHIVMSVVGSPVPFESCDLPGASDWGDVDQTSGKLEPGDSQEVNVKYDSTSLDLGTYHARFCFQWQDELGSDSMLIEIPVTLQVNESVPDPTVPDDTVPDTTVPDTTVPDGTGPDDTVPDDGSGWVDPDPDVRFGDVAAGHLFDYEIHWLAANGITYGCNPPDNTLFCPDDDVSRGQMAAFLVRALDLEWGDAGFEDTAGHVFEEDIAALAAHGVTYGCNPPDNTLFCPDADVSRGQMAAFLVRALDLDAGDAGFEDTSGHVFEDDISSLAAHGITYGCNPPENTRFCPDDEIIRGQMAAFLYRALDG